METNDAGYYILYAKQILQICLVNRSILSAEQYQQLISCNEIISSKGNDNDKRTYIQYLEDAKSEFSKDNSSNHINIDDLIGHFKTCCKRHAASINTSPTKNLRSI